MLLGCGGSAPPTVDSKQSPSSTDPAASVPLAVKTWKETEELIAGHQGKVVVVDIWSTWCGPCIQEFPGLVKLHQKHRGDVVCISLNLNYSGAKGESPDESREEVLKFLNKQNADFQNILCADPDSDIYKKLGLAAVPAVLVYDKTGQMRKRFDNETEEYGKEGFKYDPHIIVFVEMLLNE
jgi:thiol-disulfide isomerase/thioredoxin